MHLGGGLDTIDAVLPAGAGSAVGTGHQRHLGTRPPQRRASA
jgi:hypothetical protein